MENVEFTIFKNENYVDLSLYQCGREICKPGHVFGPAARNHYLFHYVISGKGKLYSAGSDGIDKDFEIHAGQGFLLFPGQLSTYVADREDPWTYAWIEFDGLRVKEALGNTSMTKDNPIYRTHTPAIRDAMYKEMNDLILHNQENTTFWSIGHLYLFFNDLVQSTRVMREKKNSRLADYYVKEAISVIEENYQNALSVEDIAQALGIDRSYFGKVFKRVMGKSPQQFLISYRLIKAAELLKTTEQPIGDIAASVGYENQLHFSRAFKAAYGQSPRDWRKSETVLPLATEQ